MEIHHKEKRSWTQEIWALDSIFTIAPVRRIHVDVGGYRQTIAWRRKVGRFMWEKASQHLSTHIIFHSSSDVELGVPSNVVNAHDNLPHSQSFCSRTTATPT